MTSTREQFEAAFVEEEVRLHGEGIRSQALHMIEQNTTNVRSAWWAWQASRKAVVVELPSRASEAYREHFDDVEGGNFNESAYIRDVRQSIEAQGLKVAP